MICINFQIFDVSFCSESLKNFEVEFFYVLVTHSGCIPPAVSWPG